MNADRRGFGKNEIELWVRPVGTREVYKETRNGGAQEVKELL
jgi:hypothetical protein